MPSLGLKYPLVYSRNQNIGYDLESIPKIFDPFPERVDLYHNHWQYRLEHRRFEDFPILTF